MTISPLRLSPQYCLFCIIAEKESVFTRMVEVSPQYIIVNLTSQDIFFGQSNVNMN